MSETHEATPGEAKLEDLAPVQDPKGGEVKNETLFSELLSNISKTRSEISQTFARNTRG